MLQLIRSVTSDLLNPHGPHFKESFRQIFFTALFCSPPSHISAPQVLKSHLLLFRLPQLHSEFGFDVYEQLPPIRAKRLESLLQTQESSSDQKDWRWDWDKTWKERTVSSWNRREEEAGTAVGGVKWDADFSSKRVSHNFCVDPGYRQLLIK